MKKCFLIFLCFAKLFAQEMPIAESNAFVYNKYNYGNDFLNGSVFYNDDQSGSVFYQPYNGAIFEIGNTSSEQSIHYKNNSYPTLQKVISSPTIKYYCTFKSIIAVTNKNSKTTFLLNKNKEYAYHFEKKGNVIYFLNDKSEDNAFVALNKFDGKKVLVVKKLSAKDVVATGLISDEHHLYYLITTTFSSKIFAVKNNSIELVKEYVCNDQMVQIFNFTDVENFDFRTTNNYAGSVRKGVFKKSTNLCPSYIFLGGLFSKSINNDSIIPLANSSWGDSFIYKLYSTETNSYYCSTNGDFLRLFPHIKKYPRLFYNDNSNSVFALQQDHRGQIWAGSYQGVLSVITNNNKVIQSKTSTIKFLNGSLNYKDKMLFFGESNKGLLSYDGVETNKVVTDSFVGFYAYRSKNKKLYIGTAQKGLWFTDLKNVDSKNKIEWTKICDKQGMTIENVLTITADRFGNIWSAGRGISVYNPKTKKAITWKANDIPSREFLRSRASILDSHNNLWFGTKDGALMTYNGKNATDYDIKNFSFIKHPLLENGKTITFIHQWNHFLILGANDKVLLFDLQKWYANKKVAVRYLNPLEINLTSGTEQNTILTDKRDESIWFSSSDMVYQWGIKKWLTLPTFTVVPTVLIQKDSIENEYKTHQCIEFKPLENSFDIQIKYQTRDNMPRFVNGILVKKGEKPVFEHPNLETKFQINNISAGDYVFYVRVCQQDGSFNVFEYPIVVDSFIWNKWWFWPLLMIPFLGIIIYFFQNRNQIEKQKKRLSQLNLSSLSNQFRPHFMLNALNSIGSQMEGKPHAEKVISRLGESINILYGFTQKNDFTLPFGKEFKLVENSIEIQRLLFMPNLTCVINNRTMLPANVKIPVGLLQIPVENALLHGLRNKTDGVGLLEMDFMATATHYIITITDNGVGRQNADKINNFKKNGNGLRTIYEMITIINQHQKNAIAFEIIDQNEPSGTIVKIALNKNIDYDKIKI
jgi:hypothetical protein